MKIALTIALATIVFVCQYKDSDKSSKWNDLRNITSFTKLLYKCLSSVTSNSETNETKSCAFSKIMNQFTIICIDKNSRFLSQNNSNEWESERRHFNK